MNTESTIAEILGDDRHGFSVIAFDAAGRKEERSMTKLQVFDPPMCCSTGVCGPNPDPVLPRFASDLQWLANEQRVPLSKT